MIASGEPPQSIQKEIHQTSNNQACGLDDIPIKDQYFASNLVYIICINDCFETYIKLISLYQDNYWTWYPYNPAEAW
jgi:hypothetical protein